VERNKRSKVERERGSYNKAMVVSKNADICGMRERWGRVCVETEEGKDAEGGGQGNW
jgi:hypothetical protein